MYTDNYAYKEPCEKCRVSHMDKREYKGFFCVFVFHLIFFFFFFERKRESIKGIEVAWVFPEEVWFQIGLQG